MSKNNFVPPLPNIKPPSEETIKKMQNLSPEHKKHVQEAVRKTFDREKQLGKDHRHKWWASNWISLLGLLFSAIAALPVILQGIETILKLIGLSS